MPLITTSPYIREYGLLLNGTDQYGFHDVDLVNLLAISIWVKPTSTITTSTNDQYILSTEKLNDTVGAPLPHEGWILGTGTGFIVNETIRLSSSTGDTNEEYRTAVQNFTLTGGVWYNLIINWTGSRYDIVVNGSTQTVTSGTSDGHLPQLEASTTTVGGVRYVSGATPTNYLSATIANLIFFDTALTGGQITTIVNGGPNGPTSISGNEVGIYKFDDGTGSTATDTSSGGNDLTLVNSPTWL